MAWKSEIDIVDWQLRAVKSSAQMQSKHDPMGGEDGVEWLPPLTLEHTFLWLNLTTHEARLNSSPILPKQQFRCKRDCSE